MGTNLIFQGNRLVSSYVMMRGILLESNNNNLVGKILGTCTLEKLIGQGGMGSVYLARQARPSRYVAVKVLLPNLIMDSQVYQEFLARFRREADVIAKLEHINIMPIYEYGEQDGIAYLVMPYLPGGSLRDGLERSGALPLRETVTYISQAAAALDYAHAHKVIHRDLKPGNFLLHTDGRLVLADFGIARMLQDSDNTFGSKLTSTGMFIGTPEYMAPEMVTGEPIDHRADIYALGIVLFQMLSGRVPFSGNTPYAVATKHVQEPPPSLYSMNPTLPPMIDGIIQTALAKRPENRYPSAGALAQALRNAVATTNYHSETEMRNAPTVISASQSNSPIETLPRYQTPPPVQQPANTPPGSATAPAWLRNEPARGELTPPVTPSSPYAIPSPVPGNRQQPWLIFIGVLLILALIVGGVLIGLQINKGTNGTPTAANTATSSHPTAVTQITSTAQPTVAPTATTQTSVIPKGGQLYSAVSPGHFCDSGGGHWADYNSPIITCQGARTEISNSNSQSPNLVGTLLTSMPNQTFPSDYVIEAQLQQANASHADFGIYFRNQPGNQQGVYTFFIHPDGSWRAYVYDNTTGAQTEIAHGNFGNAYASVKVDVVAIGSNFSFYANGQKVGSVTDGTYPAGTVGIALDAGASIFASNFALYKVA